MVHYQSILARSNTSRTLLDLGWTWHRITRYVLFFIQSLRVWDGNVKYMRHVFFFYYPLNWNKLWRATSFFCSMTTNQDGWFLRRFLSFHIFKVVSVLFSKIEIKPCRLGSRIPDMEAEWRLWVIRGLSQITFAFFGIFWPRTPLVCTFFVVNYTFFWPPTHPRCKRNLWKAP